MGGKSKKAERRKDNARPSSSSHCAELLGNSVPIFVDFSSAKESIFGTSNEPSCNVDTNFQLVLKKMMKKDSVTKLKALQEFTCLCKSSDDKTVKSILPFWPRLYCSLAIDVEHRVREAAHVAHSAVAEKVKKSLAPYLKQLAGPWFTSQYDNYPPAASAAISAFEQAFPPEKQNKVIVFCQEEILNYIYESLITHTPQTLSNPKNTNEEEMETKYQRIVIASLQGYNLYLQKLTTDQLREAEESNKKIVSSPKFWEYSKNKIPAIRCSFFNVLISLCQNGKFLLSSDIKRVTTAIFSDLDDSDLMVMISVWDAALNALVFLENAWTHINFEKQVFPKLNAVIRKGGRNAITVFPSILPLLSKIPPDLIKNKMDFYGSLLQNIRRAMDGPTVINPSSSDGKTIAITFMECLKYIINQHDSDESLCIALVMEHLIPTLDKCLSNPKSTNSSMTIAFFAETSKALRIWYSSIASKNEPYRNILLQFWESLLKIFENNLNSESSITVLGDVLNNQLELLKILQNPRKYSDKPKRKLQFFEDSFNNGDVSEKAKEIASYEDDPQFSQELLKFVKTISGTYLKKSVMNQEELFIPILGQIVNLFDSKIIFEEFATVQNESSLYSLFCNLFSKWLERDCLRKGELVHLSFSLLQYLNKDEKELILQKFFEDLTKTDLQYDIFRSLLHYSDDDCVKSWISSDLFSNHILLLANNFVDSDCGSDKSKNIITSFLKEKYGNGEFILNANTASSVMEILSRSLRQFSDKIHVRELAQNLVVNVDREEPEFLNSREELVVALFKLSCYHGEDKNLVEACGFGLRKALSKDGNDFVKKLADAVKEIVFNDSVSFELVNITSRINYVVELTVDTNLSEGSSSNTEIERAVEIFKHFVKEPAMVTGWRDRLKKCCLMGYQSVGTYDLKFVNLMEKKREFNSLDDSQILLNKVRSGFNEFNLIGGDLNEEYLKDVLIYYKTYKKVNSGSKSHFSKSGADFTPEMMVKFAKWNIYVGGILNLILSAHPRRYKSSILLEDWNPYCVDEKQVEDFNRKNPNSDILPIRITKEELDHLEFELKNSSERFGGSEYDGKVNVFSICGEIFDFTFSIGLLVSFCQYYAGTKYFPILEKYKIETEAIGRELFMNANLLETLFFYRCCRYFVSELPDWRIMKYVLQELFQRSFQDGEPFIDSESVTDFIKSKIANSPAGNHALLKLSYIIQDKVIYGVDEDGWDKIFVCLHKCLESSAFLPNISERDLTTLSLVSRITLQLIELFSVNRPRNSDEKLCPEACLAWNEVVRNELQKEFIVMWQALAEKWHNSLVSLEILIVIQNVSEIVMQRIPSVERSEFHKLKDYIRYIQSPYTIFQITSYELLLRLVPELVRIDTETYCNNISKLTETMKEGAVKTLKCHWTCQQLEETISSTQGIVETLLSDFVIGDCCSVEPFTDSFNYTFSYLLIWCFLLEMCAEADSILRFQYGFWLRNKGYTNSLLESIFKLMPQTVIHGSEVKENCQKYFENYSSPRLKESVNSERIERIACFVYRKFLQRLPNIVRKWWSQAEHKTSSLVDKVTSLYVSPLLIAYELKNVQQDQDGCFDNMGIKTHPNAREVIATYTIDEVKMDLIMTLPQNYPLGTIKIESSNMVVSSSSRRNWLFHISKYLIHQNGTIWEALIMWKNNLDKKFEGVEECYICASILQGSTFETPKTSCRICKKKFHSHCLYKWFSTSNNSSCPICRNLF